MEKMKALEPVFVVDGYKEIFLLEDTKSILVIDGYKCKDLVFYGVFLEGRDGKDNTFSISFYGKDTSLKTTNLVLMWRGMFINNLQCVLPESRYDYDYQEYYDGEYEENGWTVCVKTSRDVYQTTNDIMEYIGMDIP